MINRISYRNLGSRVGDSYNGKCLIANPPIIIIDVIRFVRIVGKPHLPEFFITVELYCHSRIIARHIIFINIWYKIVNRIFSHKEVESVVAHSALVLLWTYALKRCIHPEEVVGFIIGRKSSKSSYLHLSFIVVTEVVTQLCNLYIERQVA